MPSKRWEDVVAEKCFWLGAMILMIASVTWAVKTKEVNLGTPTDPAVYDSTAVINRDANGEMIFKDSQNAETSLSQLVTDADGTLTTTSADLRYVNVIGDTMTGGLAGTTITLSDAFTGVTAQFSGEAGEFSLQVGSVTAAFDMFTVDYDNNAVGILSGSSTYTFSLSDDVEFWDVNTGSWNHEANKVEASAVIADNVLVRGDGGARGVQGSGITITDTDVLDVPNEINADFRLQIVEETADATGPFINLIKTRSDTPQDNDEAGIIHFFAEDSGESAPNIAARIKAKLTDVTNLSEDGQLNFELEQDGSPLNIMSLDAATTKVTIGVDFEVTGDILSTSATLVGAVANAAALLTLDQQLDDDAPFTNYKGVVANDKSIDQEGNGASSGGDDVSAPNAATWGHEGMIQIEINGATMYIPYYSKI